MSGMGAVMVTGAASGIGRAVAECLLASGRQVVAFDRSGAELDAISVPGAGESGLRRVTGDVTRPEDLDSAVEIGATAFGGIDGVVAAAGIWTPGKVGELSDTQWKRAMDVNLTGIFNTARVAVRHFLPRGKGSFVALASDAGVQGSQNCAAYIAAKHGVIGLVRAMALDYGPSGIRSNAVCPGFVETAMFRQIFDSAPAGLLEARKAEVPLGRFAQPSEIASVVEMLVGGAGSFINGAAIVIDGGSTAGYFTPPARVAS